MGVALMLVGPSGVIVARASTPQVDAKSLLANGLTVAAPAASTLPSKFQDTVVFSGLTNPTAVRFSPDGRVFVAEQSGLLLEYDSLTDTTPTTVADFRSETDDYWDRGLLGLALDPNFPTHPYVYLLYTYDAPPGQTAPVWNDACPTPPGTNTDGCVVTGKLVRIQLSGNAMSGSPTTLISGEWCQQFPSHSIGDLNFGADGELYVSGGDGASFSAADWGQFGGTNGSPPPTVANPCGDPPAGAGGTESPPTAEGGALRSQSARRSAGEPVLLNGAILRVDPATGAAAAGNPFGSSTDANKQRIVAYGLRNPFRFTVRPGTNELWIGDVGWSTWEEIDVDTSPTSTAKNFGWPCYEGTSQQSAYAGLDLCTTLYADGTASDPYYAYNHSSQVVPGESCPTADGSSITGLAFYNGGTYPSSYNGALFFADHSRNCIWAMLPGSNGLPDPTTIETFAAGAGHPVDLEVGPGGDLFYVDLEDGQIHRITYTALTVAAPVNGSSTNNAMPTLSGAAGTASGDLPTVTVRVYRGSSVTGVPVQTATATESGGRWSALAPGPLTPDGLYTAQAEQDDDAHYQRFSPSVTFTVDTTPPVVTLTAPAGRSSTNNATPTLSGSAGTASGDLPTVTVRIYRGSSVTGVPVQTATATESGGHWSALAPGPLTPDGPYTAQADQDDLAGNHGISSPVTFTVDVTTPTNTSLPAISGPRAVGQTLLCSHGSWLGTAPLSYAYQWLRDGGAIAGATGAAYRTTAADAGRTLTCRVTARSGAGSARATSAGLRIPKRRNVGTASVGRARVSGTVTSVFVKCKGTTTQTCTITLRMTIKQTLKRGKVIAVSATRRRANTSRRTVVVGTRTLTLPAGKSVNERVKLNRTGRRLLSGRGKLSVELMTTQSIISGTAVLASQTMTFKAIGKR